MTTTPPATQPTAAAQRAAARILSPSLYAIDGQYVAQLIDQEMGVGELVEALRGLLGVIRAETTAETRDCIDVETARALIAKHSTP